MVGPNTLLLTLGINLVGFSLTAVHMFIKKYMTNQRVKWNLELELQTSKSNYREDSNLAIWQKMHLFVLPPTYLSTSKEIFILGLIFSKQLSSLFPSVPFIFFNLI